MQPTFRPDSKTALFKSASASCPKPPVLRGPQRKDDFERLRILLSISLYKGVCATVRPSPPEFPRGSTHDSGTKAATRNPPSIEKRNGLAAGVSLFPAAPTGMWPEGSFRPQKCPAARFRTLSTWRSEKSRYLGAISCECLAISACLNRLQHSTIDEISRAHRVARSGRTKEHKEIRDFLWR